MPAGPGPAELDRIADTLESLHHFEPAVGRVIVVDDEPDAARDIVSVAGPLGGRTTVIPNPRDRSAHWWSEGVLVGIAAGLDEARTREPPVDWVLRMDTDALVIGPFADAVDAEFRADPDLALVGSYLWEADGTPRDVSGPARPLRRLRAPISLWRQQRTVKTGLVGLGRERRQIILDAEANGYQLGQHCQGGAYAMSMRAVEAVAARGWLDCHLWRDSYLPEDVIMSLQVKALGLHLLGMSDPGEPFAVRHVGLPGEPADLVAAGYGIAHSLKDHGAWTEDALRAEFRKLRGAA
jgi:hypothetical protein